MSNTRGVPYYYNSTDKKSSWNPPAGVHVHGLPGAEYLRDTAKAEIFESGGLPGQVRVSHLLVKHRDSRKPRNLRGEAIMITIKEATARAEQYLAVIKGMEGRRDSDSVINMFAALAREYSDCPSGARGGDLGWFGHGQMEAAFERVAYALPIRGISDVVLTDSGVHLIIKTGGATHGMTPSTEFDFNSLISKLGGQYNTPSTPNWSFPSRLLDERRRLDEAEYPYLTKYYEHPDLMKYYTPGERFPELENYRQLEKYRGLGGEFPNLMKYRDPDAKLLELMRYSDPDAKFLELMKYRDPEAKILELMKYRDPDAKVLDLEEKYRELEKRLPDLERRFVKLMANFPDLQKYRELEERLEKKYSELEDKLPGLERQISDPVKLRELEDKYTKLAAEFPDLKKQIPDPVTLRELEGKYTKLAAEFPDLKKQIPDPVRFRELEDKYTKLAAEFPDLKKQIPDPVRFRELEDKCMELTDKLSKLNNNPKPTIP